MRIETSVQCLVLMDRGMVWEMAQDVPPDALGLLTEFLSAKDEDGMVEQINKNYQHGGGWHDFSGFTLKKHDHYYSLIYPASEDGPEEGYREMARAELRDELFVLFDGSWVSVIQKDGSHREARLD